MATDEKLGHLCYKSGDGHLAFKKSSGNLIYRGYAEHGEAKVTIEWFNSDRDLDILGFWEGDQSKKCGWNQGYRGPYSSGVYQLAWSDDDTSTAGNEWITMKMSPWSDKGSHRFYVYFNFFGEGSSCRVYVEQGGKTLVKDQGCANRQGQKAETSDPYCVIEFNKDGSLKSIS